MHKYEYKFDAVLNALFTRKRILLEVLNITQCMTLLYCCSYIFEYVILFALLKFLLLFVMRYEGT